MNDHAFYLVVIAFCVLSIAQLVAAFLDKRALSGVLSDAVNALLPKLDSALVPYGAQLAPIHDAASYVESLIDEDTDALAKLLPAELRAKLVEKLDQVEALTDGEPEAQPLAERLPDPDQEHMA